RLRAGRGDHCWAVGRRGGFDLSLDDNRRRSPRLGGSRLCGSSDRVGPSSSGLSLSDGDVLTRAADLVLDQSGLSGLAGVLSGSFGLRNAQVCIGRTRRPEQQEEQAKQNCREQDADNPPKGGVVLSLDDNPLLVGAGLGADDVRVATLELVHGASSSVLGSNSAATAMVPLGEARGAA